jgi:hypothetical protein
MLVGVMLQMGLTEDQAKLKLNELSTTEIIPKMTIVDLLADAMASQYKGDEVLSPQLKIVFTAMQGSNDANTKFLGTVLMSLYSDPAPEDNNITINLNMQKANK